MKVRVGINDIFQPTTVVSDVETVTIIDDYGQPIALFVHTAQGGIWAKLVNEAGFQEAVAQLGLTSRMAVATTVADMPNGAPEVVAESR